MPYNFKKGDVVRYKTGVNPMTILTVGKDSCRTVSVNSDGKECESFDVSYDTIVPYEEPMPNFMLQLRDDVSESDTEDFKMRFQTEMRDMHKNRPPIIGVSSGISERAFFAGLAMQAMVGNISLEQLQGDGVIEKIIKIAHDCADAMERNDSK